MKKLLRYAVLLFLIGIATVVALVIAFIFAPSVFTAIDPFWLCKAMDEAEFKDALKRGFDPNRGCCVEHMIGECSMPRQNSSPLCFAAEQGTPESVSMLLTSGADVNKATEQGYPLVVAVRRGDLEIFQLLLDRGVQPQVIDPASRIAVHLGRVEMVNRLLAKVEPAELPAVCSRLACQLVQELQQPHASENHRLLLSQIIERCVDPNAFCETERLLSSLAKKDVNAPFIEVLLKRGADLNAREKNGKTVLEWLRSFYDYNSRPRIRDLLEGRSESSLGVR